jgi:hypothetical protein
MFAALTRTANSRDFVMRQCLAVISSMVLMVLVATSTTPAHAADPAVVYMDKVAKELMAAARSRSPAAINSVITRHADLGNIGLYALGDSR